MVENAPLESKLLTLLYEGGRILTYHISLGCMTSIAGNPTFKHQKFGKGKNNAAPSKMTHSQKEKPLLRSSRSSKPKTLSPYIPSLPTHDITKHTQNIQKSTTILLSQISKKQSNKERQTQ
jgi:hypothetical protein